MGRAGKIHQAGSLRRGGWPHRRLGCARSELRRGPAAARSRLRRDFYFPGLKAGAFSAVLLRRTRVANLF